MSRDLYIAGLYYKAGERTNKFMRDLIAEEYNGRISDYDLSGMFDYSLNGCCEETKIGNLSYPPSEVLKKCDPIAYRCEFNNWIDSEGLEEE